MRSPTPRLRPVAIWLLVCCALVFAMVVLGGVTRLTGSGLSIVEWQPVAGVLPPITETQWRDLFEQYQATPEYREVNAGMDLGGFKGIFWLEYLHRLVGRLIGVAFFLPFVVFLAQRRLPRRLALQLTGLFVLGGLQGLLGWLMVASGLIDVPRVSPYRLTAHLSLAIAIYAWMLWVALDLLRPASVRGLQSLRRLGWVLTGLVGVTILAGGFVAGTRAGFVFNTWPLMYGRVVPAGMFDLSPWWTNPFENLAMVQFNHRMLAYLVAALAVVWWWQAQAADVPGHVRRVRHFLLVAVAGQVVLGITTVLYVVPIPLAAAHQAGALALLTVVLYLNHALREVR